VPESYPIRRALISVSDKTGLTDFATALEQRGVDLLSTGGTARRLHEAGLRVTEVADHTGAPEIMDGRVKTLHPRIHGGILGRRDVDGEAMAEHDIEPIDLVVVNLYPFEATVARPGCTLSEAIENIDIGGPAMLRAAAKNHAYVTVVVDSADYTRVIAEMDAQAGAVSWETRAQLAAKCFAHTAAYDDAVAEYLTGIDANGRRHTFPGSLNRQYRKRQDLRYGENPHQAAAFYVRGTPAAGSLAGAEQLRGKALSYNNLADADAALACVREFDDAPACVIVKHANPCGVALGENAEDAYRHAFATDPTSAFGGIIAFNRVLDAPAASAIVDNQFAEVVIAPRVRDDALTTLARKKNLRVLAVGEPMAGPDTEPMIKPLSGGLLVQTPDTALLEEDGLRVVSTREPTADERADLLFAWRVAKFVKSNAIVYAGAGRTIGIGAGQMSRVDSARIAGLKAADAGLEVAGAVMASDAFFPFRDGLDAAAEAGIRAVIQPGGSIRDDEVIAAADEAGMAMLFTGMRHFRH